MSLFTQPIYVLTLVIVLAIWATPDVLDSIRKHPKGDTVVVRDGGSHNFFRLGLSAAIIAAALLAYFQPQGTLPYHRPYLFVVGIVLALAGFALRRWAIHTLGRFFTVNVAIASDHRVVDDGPYTYVRHPSYSGVFIAFIGLGLLLFNRLSLVVLVLPVIIMFFWRMHVEERALLDALGERYAAYMKRTKRIVPFVY